MNYYMNITNFAKNDASRRLYQEIALVEEEHVTHYGSLMDPNATWLEMLLWHEYVECYLYWSCYMTETDAYIKKLWEQNFEMELSHLHKAAELLRRYEGKEWCQVIPDGNFPKPLSLHENINYVRDILGSTVQFTTVGEDYEKVDELPTDADFYFFQNTIAPTVASVPSHNVINTHIRKCGKDYRYETKPNPIRELRCRTEDNTDVGRRAGAAPSTNFVCNE